MNAVKDKKNKLVQRLVKKMLECEDPLLHFPAKLSFDTV